MSPIAATPDSDTRPTVELIAAENNKPKVDESAFRLEDFALAAIADQLPPANQHPPELALVCDRFTRLTQHHTTWHEAFTQSRSAPPHPSDVPLLQLALNFSLSPLEQLTLALTAAVEENVHVGRALARIQAPIGGSRPTLSLLTAALSPISTSASPLAQLVNGNAIATGLLTLSETAAPLPEQVVSVPRHIHFALAQ
ncbi:MAG: hypothetical protein AAGL17_23340, partial [Cyanobacteria bacterium J06576_12]